MEMKKKVLLILRGVGIPFIKKKNKKEKKNHETTCLIVRKSSQWSNQLWHCWCTAPYTNDDGSAGAYRVRGNTR